MCGRIEYIVSKREILEKHYGAILVEGYAEQGIAVPHYNIPPSAITPILTSENTEEIVAGHWGFLPIWAAEKKAREVINARAETVLEKPYFKSAITKRRCLIPVTGFFEWKREEKKKTPYRFHRGGEIFSLAGVYTTVKNRSGMELPHYAILTTSANQLMAPIHDRMPVVVPTDREAEWVTDGLTPEAIASFFSPIDADYLEMYQISSLVNKPSNNSPEILKPLPSAA